MALWPYGAPWSPPFEALLPAPRLIKRRPHRPSPFAPGTACNTIRIVTNHGGSLEGHELVIGRAPATMGTLNRLN